MKNNEIMCINDGIVFPTPATAAKYYFMTEVALSKVLAGRQRTSGLRSFAAVPENVKDPDEYAAFRRDALAELLHVSQISRSGLDVFFWTPEGLIIVHEGSAA